MTSQDSYIHNRMFIELFIHRDDVLGQVTQGG